MELEKPLWLAGYKKEHKLDLGNYEIKVYIFANFDRLFL